MEMDLDDCIERFLHPLVKESPCGMSEVPLEHNNGWKAISIRIDSGASDAVAPAGTFPGVPIYEANASKSN